MASGSAKGEQQFLPNRKLEAIKSLYRILKHQKFWSLSFQDIQNIFVERNTSEFIDMFEALVFQQTIGDLNETELIAAIQRFTRELDIHWPAVQSGELQSSHHLERKYSPDISESIKQKRETGLEEITSQVQKFIQSYQDTSFKSSDFIRYFSPQLLQCMHRYITEDGFEKAKILARLKSLIRQYHEECAWWTDVQERCVKSLGNKQIMTLAEFQKVFPMDEFMSSRIFALADQNGDGEVDRQELFAVASTLVMGDSSQKLKFLFSIYDQNGDGKLDRMELEHALGKGITQSKLNVEGNSAGLLTDLLFAKAKECGTSATDSDDEPSVETISYEEMHHLLCKNPALYDNLNICLTTSRSEQENSPSVSLSERLYRVKQHACMYTSLWVWLVLMSAITIAIGGERLNSRLEMYNRDGCCIGVIVAKTCGQMLNFLLALPLLFVLKDWITRCQKMWLRHYLPFDDVIYLHKLTAVIAFLISGIHVIAHVVNIVLRILESDEGVHAYFASPAVSKLVFTSGVILIVVLIIFSVTASSQVRAKSYSAFYISHKVLFIVWYVALLCHAKMFIFWLIFPGTLYLLERVQVIYKVFRNKSIIEFASTHDNVTILSIKKPDHFTYNPGDYVIVRVPEVSQYLWRPFTISSGKQDEITLHIRKVGLWTGKVYEMVNQMEKAGMPHGEVNEAFKNRFMVNVERDVDIESIGDGNGNISTNHMNGNEHSVHPTASKRRQATIERRQPVSVNWQIFMDGPFSTPSHDILKTEHAILVAGGIGITPFASVLASVIEQLKESSKVCPCGCETRVYFGNSSTLRLKRIDLFWLTRSHKSLHWFMDVFKELEKEQISLGLDPPLVNFHLHLTGLAKETDMRGTFLQLALSTAYDSQSTDLLTGLKAQTKPGRPDWEQVLPNLIQDAEPLKSKNGTSEKRSKSKVYVCGPVQLCKDLKRYCSKLKLPFREEVFN